jgi:hypothetical protein
MIILLTSVSVTAGTVYEPGWCDIGCQLNSFLLMCNWPVMNRMLERRYRGCDVAASDI